MIKINLFRQKVHDSTQIRRPVMLLCLTALWIFAIPGGPQSGRASDVPPDALSVNGIDTAVDLDVAPRFGWHVNTTWQTAYEIRVASTRDAAQQAIGDVWSSGKVSSSAQNDILYTGDALAPATRYFWTVRTWDARGRKSNWSKVGSFGTGPGETWTHSTPIWAAPVNQDSGDFILTAQMTINETALGIRFRSPDTRNGYMWQFRGSDNRLVPHIQVNGGFTALAGIDLPAGTLTIGDEVEMSIEARGAMIETRIDGVLVHSMMDTTFRTGGVGVRTGNYESGALSSVSLVDTRGETLFYTDFSDGDSPIPCGTVVDGALQIPRASNCAYQRFGDYALTVDLTIDEVALGLRFRSPDTSNGYMWQFRGADNRLVPHLQVNGGFSTFAAVDLPAGTLAIGKKVQVRIEAKGALIQTFIDGVPVHSLQDTTFFGGGIGVRTGNYESGAIDSLSLVDTSGKTLLSTDFQSGDRTIACGIATDGALRVPRASNCLNSGLNVDWAFVRKEFHLGSAPIAAATVYATSTNPLASRQYVYKLFLNGQFVGLGPTRPIGDENRFDGFDVTHLLRGESANALAAIAYTRDGQTFQAELVVTHTDGTEEVIGTDNTWMAIPGDTVFPTAGSIGTNYYAAPRENFSALYYPYGFDAPGFDDSTWKNAVEKGAIGNLKAAPMAKVQQQLHPPVAIVDKGAGNYFVDFGRTWVGGIRYDVAAGAAGQIIDVRFGEVPSAKNTVRYQLNTGNTYQDIYTMRDGAQTFQTWGMRVFRYVEIIGAPEPVTAQNLQALALVYPFDNAEATFTASDKNLEAVWQLSKNTIEAVNVNFYTDSWTRERENYEADAYLQLLSTLYLSNDLSLGRYSIDYFQNHRTWPTEWPLYVILAVHDAWRQTGEKGQLQTVYENLKARLPDGWYDTDIQLIGKAGGSNGCNSATDCDIVDWPASQRDGYVFAHYNTVLNALSYRAYRDMADIAAAIGEDGDAVAFASRADALRKGINSHLYVADTGRYDDGMDANGNLTGHSSLHANAFPLAFEVPSDAITPAVADYVASRGMACSVYGAAFLLDGLYNAGEDTAALDLLTSTETASWMNMISLGAGAVAEAWDPSMKNNLTYSHPWAASPAFVVPSGLFGIEPLETGYASFRIKPQPAILEYAAIKVPTVRGTIGASFNRSEAGHFQLAVQIPGNTAAEISIPVPEGTTTLYVDLKPQTVTTQNGYAEVTNVTAGCHVISAEANWDAFEDAPLLQVCTDSPAVGYPDVFSCNGRINYGW